MAVKHNFETRITLAAAMPVQTKLQTAKKRAANRALGQRLARLRKAFGYSQTELARRAGVVQVMISDYERGKLRVSADMAVRLAAALGCPVGNLLQPAATVPVVPAPPAPSRRFLRRLRLIEQLPERQQAAIAATIDAFLKAHGRAS